MSLKRYMYVIFMTKELFTSYSFVSQLKLGQQYSPMPLEQWLFRAMFEGLQKLHLVAKHELSLVVAW